MKREEDNKTVLEKSGRETSKTRKIPTKIFLWKKKIKEIRSKAQKANFKS